RPADGACRLWHWREQQAHCLTPDGFSARSRVYEYGGGSFCLGEDVLVFVNESDQQIYLQGLDGSAPRALTVAADCRYGDVLWHAGAVLAVEEQHADSVVHRLVCFANEGRQVLAEGADFYSAPTLSEDG
ncbi:S9 family peptidase, partial [Pseudomonas shirazensis]